METELWDYLKTATKPIVLYGMGNGADKIIKVLEEKNEDVVINESSSAEGKTEERKEFESLLTKNGDD